ncbi:MAG: DNA-processing protein DprA [Oscillospiraceae bacterium]|nr:DNA-processing protein DprA [Oscillospiraceae bacterium]
MEDKRPLWIWLAEVLGACNAKYIDLLRTYDYIGALYERRNSTELQKLLTPLECKNARTTSLDDCRRILERCDEQGIRILTYADERYPQQLRLTRVPPAVLYCTGDADALGGNAVAGVGSRSASAYGRDAVRRICTPLAGAGLLLVSGLAAGCDTQVHRAALDAGKRTVAVLGTAIDRTYPAQNAALRAEIECSGAVVSEYPPGTPSHRGMFPQRNRIISGLSRGVIIFEAAKKSGTMITASWALDDGREVFAVPGSIFSETSAGTNHLIKLGASPVTCAKDVLDAFGLPLPAEHAQLTPAPNLTDLQKKILRALGAQECTADELLDAVELPAHELFAALTELEMDGAVEPLPGAKYKATHTI